MKYLAVGLTAILASHSYLRKSAMQLKSTTPPAGHMTRENGKLFLGSYR